MCHQSSHLSSSPRRCVTRCVTLVTARLVAPPTQMESKTCTCCKHECIDWKSLPPLVFPMYNLSMQPCHPARYSPSPMCLLQGLSRSAMLHQQGDGISHSHETVPPCRGVDQAQRMVSAMQSMQRDHFGTAAIHQRGAGVTHPVRPEGTCGS